MKRLAVLAILLGGCDFNRPLGSTLPDAALPDAGGQNEFVGCQEVRSKDKVDVLFLVDNAGSMAPMSDELRARFDQFTGFFEKLAMDGYPVDLQIGVVTSDYGAGATGAPGCSPSPGGQLGKLQAIGQAAAVGCQAPVGPNFIRYNYKDGSNNLPVGQNLLQTFTCMASVGVQGCGFEHQLESVYAALHDNLPENAGFLRDDALLAIVFLSNEDDSSAPPVTDLFDPSAKAQYGFLFSYRSTQYGIVCGPGEGQLPPYGDSGGLLTNCRPAPNPRSAIDNAGVGPGRLYDVSRYIDFFTKPASQGGVKAQPSDVLLVGIDAPSEPVQVILSNPHTPGSTPYQPCGALNESSNPPCVPVLQHSCQNPQNPAFFGDPAVRLNVVVNAAQNHRVVSICSADYTDALRDLARMVSAGLRGGCVCNDLQRATCVVVDRTTVGGTATDVQIPRCETGGPRPCWNLSAQPYCEGTSPQSLTVTVERTTPPPDGTVTYFSCSEAT